MRLFTSPAASLRIPALALSITGCNVILGLDSFSSGTSPDGSTLPDAAPDADAGGPPSSPCDPACVGAARVCNPSTLACVGCLASTDCMDASADLQQCDMSTNRCWECATGNDCSSQGSYNLCDLNTHQCAQCLSDPECPSGMTCTIGPDQRNACYKKCATNADCQGMTNADAGDAGNTAIPACCNGLCVDTSSNTYYCGGCSTNCTNLGGTLCCNSGCFNGTRDQNNCGSCGQKCSQSGSFETCVSGSCTCPTGYSLNSSELCENQFLIQQSNLVNLPYDCSDGGNPYLNFNPAYPAQDTRNVFGFEWIDDAGAYGFSASGVQIEFMSGWNCYPGAYIYYQAYLNGAASPSANLFQATGSTTCQCYPVTTYQNFSLVNPSNLGIVKYFTNGTPNQMGLVLVQGYALDGGPTGQGLSVNTSNSGWIGSYGRVTVTY